MAGGKSSAIKVNTVERRTLALNLRKSGATYRAIAVSVAEKLGIPKYSEAQAHRDVTAELDRIAKQNAETATTVRTLELERLDQYLLAIARDVQKGDFGAIDRALKIMERRARLQGLDAPLEFKVQELVQTKVTEEVNMIFEAVAANPSFTDEQRREFFNTVAKVQGQAAVAGEN
jgi:phosphoglycolate phosphatase-like HAD superfamily hydrolase